MSAIPSRIKGAGRLLANDVTALVPDFPFHYAQFLQQAVANAKPLGQIASQHYGSQVLIVGAGAAGLVAAYEAMRMGLHPVVVEASVCFSRYSLNRIRSSSRRWKRRCPRAPSIRG